jgi:hypothetical protein
MIFGLRSRAAEARHCYANRLGWTREIIASPTERRPKGETRPESSLGASLG